MVRSHQLGYEGRKVEDSGAVCEDSSYGKGTGWAGWFVWAELWGISGESGGFCCCFSLGNFRTLAAGAGFMSG